MNCTFEVGHTARIRGFQRMHTIVNIVKEDGKFYCIFENGFKVAETDLCKKRHRHQTKNDKKI